MWWEDFHDWSAATDKYEGTGWEGKNGKLPVT